MIAQKVIINHQKNYKAPFQIIKKYIIKSKIEKKTKISKFLKVNNEISKLKK